ncbi:MAG TPA: MFS transporter [Acidimicrobiales bacterium]
MSGESAGTRVKDALRESRVAVGQVFRNPALRRLQLAFAGSVMGDWAYAVAASIYAFEQGGAKAVGILGVIRYVLISVVMPFAATLADRLPRKLIMISVDLARAAIIAIAALVIASDGPAMVVYALAILGSVASTPFRPAQGALLPTLARNPGELTAANVSSSTIESVGFFTGPAIAAFLLSATSIPWVYLFDSITFVWSAVLVVGVHVPKKLPEPDLVPAAATLDPDAAPSLEAAAAAEAAVAEHEAKESFLRVVFAGYRTIIHHRDLRLVMGLYAAQTIVAGASLVFEVAIALELLDMGRSGLGLLDSVLGVGGLVGGFAAIMLAQRNRLATDFGFGVIGWSAPLLLVAISPTLPAALACMVIIGVSNSVVDVNAQTILQRVVPDEVMGRVFGAMDSLLVGGMAVGALAMPILMATVGLRTGLVVIGGVVTALVLLGIAGLRRIDRTLLAPPYLELLRGVPILSPLPDRILERLAFALVKVPAPAGTVVFREGDEGDRFYVVESGSVEIERGGKVLNVLGPGDMFGEIALLQDVPRTATVTAVADTLLLALERGDFLPAVTGHGESVEAADNLISIRVSAW